MQLQLQAVYLYWMAARIWNEVRGKVGAEHKNTRPAESELPGYNVLSLCRLTPAFLTSITLPATCSQKRSHSPALALNWFARLQYSLLHLEKRQRNGLAEKYVVISLHWLNVSSLEPSMNGRRSVWEALADLRAPLKGRRPQAGRRTPGPWVPADLESLGFSLDCRSKILDGMEKGGEKGDSLCCSKDVRRFSINNSDKFLLMKFILVRQHAALTSFLLPKIQSDRVGLGVGFSETRNLP